MNNEIITTTGYYDTGSSAVYVLLKEYSSCTEGRIKDLDVEHLIFYTPNGLFDLEDKLLIGNNIHRSDEALHSFYEEMKRLYENDFIWFGNYKKIFGKNFMDAVECLIESLTQIKMSCIWYYDFETTKFSIKHCLGSLRNILLGKPISGHFAKGIVYRKKQLTRYSYVNEDEFYKAGRVFINNYLELVRGNCDGKLILDHFLLPNNLFRINNYFDDNLKVILVERDPRDVFAHAIEEANSKNTQPRIPYNVEDFITYWKGLRNSVKETTSPNVLKIQFEDLIFKYEETVKRIEEFCGLKQEDHIYKMKYFDLEKSRKNTQLFLKNTNLEREIKTIEHELSEYLYDFPNP